MQNQNRIATPSSNGPFENAIDFTSPSFVGGIPSLKPRPAHRPSDASVNVSAPAAPSPQNHAPRNHEIKSDLSTTTQGASGFQSVDLPELPQDVVQVLAAIEPYEPIQLRISSPKQKVPLVDTASAPKAEPEHKPQTQPEPNLETPSNTQYRDQVIAENVDLKRFNKTLMQDIGEHTRLIQHAKEEIEALRAELKSSTHSSQRARKALIVIRDEVEKFKRNYKRMLSAREKHIHFLENELRRMKTQNALDQNLKTLDQNSQYIDTLRKRA